MMFETYAIQKAESRFGDVPGLNIDEALKIAKNRIEWKNLRPSNAPDQYNTQYKFQVNLKVGVSTLDVLCNTAELISTKHWHL